MEVPYNVINGQPWTKTKNLYNNNIIIYCSDEAALYYNRNALFCIESLWKCTRLI